MTAASIKLDIMKMALSDANTSSSITSPSDGSPEANTCSLYYNYIRDQALRAARWNFAKRSVNLTVWKALPGTPEATAAATTTGLWSRAFPQPPWLYAYVIPGDYLYARRVIGQGTIIGIPSPPIFPYNSIYPTQWMPGARFEIANDTYDLNGALMTQSVKVINTDQENAIMDYTYQASDETLWDGMFVQVQTAALAARLAVAVSGDRALAQLRTEQANSLILQARVASANESLTIHDHVPDWLRVRGIGNPMTWDYVYPYGPLFITAP